MNRVIITAAALCLLISSNNAVSALEAGKPSYPVAETGTAGQLSEDNKPSEKDTADADTPDDTAKTAEQKEQEKKPKKKKKKIIKQKKIVYVTYAEYFKDSLFVGDSICSGLKIYRGLLNTRIVAAKGNVAARSLSDYTFPYDSDSRGELDAYSIAALRKPKDIYIWMGMNDINVVSEESFVAHLESITANFRKVSPDSMIHIVSITPISRNHKWNYSCDGSNKIKRYNAAAERAFSERDDADWINVHDALADSDGYLLPAYSGGDGLHLSSSAYFAVLRSIYQHKAAAAAANELTNDSEK